MKKLLFFIPFLFMLSACNTTDQENAIPGMQEIPAKEIITLKSGIQVEKIDGFYVSGDVILNAQQLEMLDNMGTRAYITNDYVKTWPNRVVYYTLGDSYNPAQMDILNHPLYKAMRHWNENAGISFVRRTTQPDYVEINTYNGMISLSGLGRATGKQQLQIVSGATTGDIIHLLGHTVGLMDEHSRPDRDDHIRIHPENTIPGWEALYFGINTAGIKYGNFDFGSIMLHSPYLYSFTGQPTMTRLDGTAWTQNTTRLSDKDIEAVTYLYSEYTRSLNVFYLEGWDPVVKVGETRGIWAEYISPTCSEPRFNFTVRYPGGGTIIWATNVERTTFTFNSPGVYRITATVANDIVSVSNYIDIEVVSVQNVYPQLVTTPLFSTVDNQRFENRVKFWEDDRFTIPLTYFENNHILIATKWKTTTYASGLTNMGIVETIEHDLRQGPASDYILSNTYFRTYVHQVFEDDRIVLDQVVSERTAWFVEVATMVLH